MNKTDLAKKIRLCILDLIYKTKSPHIGSAFSCVELLLVLYYDIMNISPSGSKLPDRDRFIMSKGHACAALYAVLKEKGFLSKSDLSGFAINRGTLEQHPSMDLKQGIEVSTGSLGHGLSIGAGMALAGKKDRNKQRIFVLLSDGELDEGSTWEAVLFAAQHKLDNLTAIVDYNKMQALGFTKDTLNLDPLADKWLSFGWSVREVDGHDYKKCLGTFKKIPFDDGKPSVVIAHTVKGKGVSFMENNLLWHYRPPDTKEYAKAKKELKL